MIPSIDVVVPIYGNWDVTATCLASLGAQSADHRVIVVDDCSPDDSRARLAAEYPLVDVVALDRNVGFAAACNRGIEHGDGAIVVLLNNDVIAEPDLLERLVAPLDSEDRLGSAVPLLLRPDGRVDAYGLCADVTMAGFARCQGMSPEGALAARTPALLGPYGAVAAYRRSALDDVGLLDEGIVMYGEELDLALRLSLAGWRTIAVPAARAVHIGGATSGRGSPSQRQRGGFGRGYLLRVYGVLRGRTALRAIVTELIVCAGDAILSRDLASTRGRMAGWRSARGGVRRSRHVPGVDRSIGFIESLRLRVGDYRAR